MSELLEPNEPAGRLTGDEVTQLTGHLAALTASGLPLPSGLRALGEELPGHRLRPMLNRLAEQLEAGESLDQAIKGQGGRLPPHLRGLVLAGVRTGKLGEVLGRFAGYANVGIELRRALWIRLAYPLLTAALAMLVFVFVCVVLVNGISRILMDFGLQLPGLTRLVLKIAAVVDRVWLSCALGFLGLAAVVLIGSIVLRPGTRRSMAWTIPVIGPVWHFSDLAEFSHMLALLLESEVPLLEALPMAGAAVRNSRIESRAEQVARQVSGGEPLALALTCHDLFPRGFSRIIAWGEQNRGLPETLHMVGEMFESRARSQAGFVSTVCSILAGWSIFCGLFILVVAIFIPLMTLIRMLSG